MKSAEMLIAHVFNTNHQHHAKRAE
jgi:hypothetical protein